MGLPQNVLVAKRKLRELTRKWNIMEACGTDGTDRKNVRVYVSNPAAMPGLPREIDGVPVEVVSSGQLKHLQSKITPTNVATGAEWGAQIGTEVW